MCIRDRGKPVAAPRSVSVRDGWEEVESRHSMLADLLLMSEIKDVYKRQPCSSREIHKAPPVSIGSEKFHNAR